MAPPQAQGCLRSRAATLEQERCRCSYRVSSALATRPSSSSRARDASMIAELGKERT
ncbi:MAG: hypothetical protein JWN04_1641 [Myxococcaceae bacterium]|nr:hypothetical protein [Myxococcaceae bacterium]